MNNTPLLTIERTATHHGRGKMIFPLILIMSLFFFWGFVHNLDPVLIPHLKRAFSLTDLQTAFIDFSVFIAYFFMALPAGMLMEKYGYKPGIIFGLLLFSAGSFLFIPAAVTGSYLFFLGALFTIACGLTFLETAANPYIIKLGDPQTATQRLNFAQSFNGLAAFLAPIVGGKVILSGPTVSDLEIFKMVPSEKHAFLISEAASVKIPYAIIGSLMLVLMVLFLFSKLPTINDKKEAASRFSVLSVLRYPRVRLAVIAQFFYVGAQVCILSFFIRFAISTAQITAVQASWYAGGAGLSFMIGRFAGTFLMKFLKPHFLLIIYALLCIIFTLAAIFSNGIFPVYALIIVCFFMSIMFPTIFSLGITGLGDETKIASSLLVMSVVGGALLPLLLGYISDATGHLQYAFVVPVFCFLIVLLFGLRFQQLRILKV